MDQKLQRHNSLWGFWKGWAVRDWLIVIQTFCIRMWWWFLGRGLTKAFSKLPVRSDQLTIFSIVGPRNCHGSLKGLAGRALEWQEAGTTLDNISSVFCKNRDYLAVNIWIFCSATSAEVAEGTNFASNLFSLRKNKQTKKKTRSWKVRAANRRLFWLSLATASKRNPASLMIKRQEYVALAAGGTCL